MKRMGRLKIGKTAHGTKWHFLKGNNLPLCGYTSFVWLNVGFETRIVEDNNLNGISLCHNCQKIFAKKKKKESLTTRTKGEQGL